MGEEKFRMTPSQVSDLEDCEDVGVMRSTNGDLWMHRRFGVLWKDNDGSFRLLSLNCL